MPRRNPASSVQLLLETLAERAVPAGVHFYAVGEDVNGGSVVAVYRADGTIDRTIVPFDSDFTGAVHVATGDVTGDGTDDVVVAAGPRGGPVVKVIDGVTGATLREFLAYDESFRGGVNVAVGDVNGDGHFDIVTGAGSDGGPNVKVFDGATGAQIASFFAYENAFRGGVTVAAGDITGDGKADIVSGTGIGGGPRARVFDGATFSGIRDFFAYEPSFRGGITVAAGDVTADGRADIITGTGAGGGARVVVFNAVDGAIITDWLAFMPTFRGGVAVGTTDIDGDGTAEIITAAGPGYSPLVKIFDGTPENNIVRAFQPFNANFYGGITTGQGNATANSPYGFSGFDDGIRPDDAPPLFIEVLGPPPVPATTDG